MEVLGVVLLSAALIVLVAVAVKVYDVRRTRDEEALILQARLSDALLLDPSLAGCPVVASVTMTFWGRSLPAVTVSGTVPSVELRDLALRIVEREVSRSPEGARIEDRLVVNPMMLEHVA